MLLNSIPWLSGTLMMFEQMELALLLAVQLGMFSTDIRCQQYLLVLIITVTWVIVSLLLVIALLQTALKQLLTCYYCSVMPISLLFKSAPRSLQLLFSLVVIRLFVLTPCEPGLSKV